MNETILQNFSVAFLKRDGYYLLMKRSTEKKIASGVWCGVGGKQEPHEINDPFSACVREIQEETGISSDHLFHLHLKYLILRRYKNIIRQNYVYFGETDCIDLSETDEGVLHWIPECELLHREHTKTFDAMLRHYTTNPDEKNIVIGVAENIEGKLHMAWSTIEDFE